MFTANEVYLILSLALQPICLNSIPNLPTAEFYPLCDTGTSPHLQARAPPPILYNYCTRSLSSHSKLMRHRLRNNSAMEYFIHYWVVTIRNSCLKCRVNFFDITGLINAGKQHKMHGFMAAWKMCLLFSVEITNNLPVPVFLVFVMLRQVRLCHEWCHLSGNKQGLSLPFGF